MEKAQPAGIVESRPEGGSEATGRLAVAELQQCRHSFAYLTVSRKSSGILWQDLLHGIAHNDFGL
jgi:hypothetical protein